MLFPVSSVTGYDPLYLQNHYRLFNAERNGTFKDPVAVGLLHGVSLQVEYGSGYVIEAEYPEEAWRGCSPKAEAGFAGSAEYAEQAWRTSNPKAVKA